MNDERLERIIGNLLRAGVILAAVLVLIGGAFYLARHGGETPSHAVFKGEPPAWSSLRGVFSAATLESGRGLIMAGLLALILTPVTRVAFSIGAFALQRDWQYAGIASIVLGLLIYGLTSA